MSHATKHKHLSSVYPPPRMWVPLSHPLIRVWPLNSQFQYLERCYSSQLKDWHEDVAISVLGATKSVQFIVHNCEDLHFLVASVQLYVLLYS